MSINNTQTNKILQNTPDRDNYIGSNNDFKHGKNKTYRIIVSSKSKIGPL